MNNIYNGDVKHTPAPWEVDTENNVRGAHPLCKKSVIAPVLLNGVSVECARANAALISAAPEMLWTLKMVAATDLSGADVRVVNIMFDYLKAICNDAINKAENKQ